MRKRHLFLTTTILLLAGGVSGAASSPVAHRSSSPTANAKGSTPRGVATVVSANNRFAFDLYSKLRDAEKGNIFYSPYSISAALAMTYEGAAGKTASEMKDVFHFPKRGTLRSNFAAIYNGLNKANSSYRLRTGNALWVQKSFPLLTQYPAVVKSYYGGQAKNLDFANQTEQSHRTINRYIATQTADTIKDLIPPGTLTTMTRVVLTNAIYFKGTWQWEFDPSNTRPGDFKVTTSKTVKAPMMYFSSYKAAFNYADTGGLQIIELPYKGDTISMLLLLPHGDLNSIESSLTANKLKAYRARMKPTVMDSITIPKFAFTGRYDLKDTLRDLGMPTAFSDSADLSGMTGKRDLFLSFVVHQAYVKVDEKGTEAAGATAGGSNLTSVRIPLVFDADHPFVFLIQDRKTGNVLFLGRVVNPNESG